MLKAPPYPMTPTLMSAALPYRFIPLLSSGGPAARRYAAGRRLPSRGGRPCIVPPSRALRYRFSNAASKAVPEGAKSASFTNAQASRAPCSRSMPASSHSTESGPS